MSAHQTRAASSFEQLTATSLGFAQQGPMWPTRHQGDGMESTHTLIQEAVDAAVPVQHTPFPPIPSFHGKSIIPPLTLSGRSSPQVSLAQPMASVTSAGVFPSPPHIATAQQRTAECPTPTAATASATATSATSAAAAALPAVVMSSVGSASLPPHKHPAFQMPAKAADSSSTSPSRSQPSPLRKKTLARDTQDQQSLSVTTTPKKKVSKEDESSSPIQLEHLRSVGRDPANATTAASDRARKRLVKEKAELGHQLEVQRKRNGELKRLLVASIGADLQERFDALCHEKAESSETLVLREKELQLLRERVEHLAIQCDVYQSKYRASSVMIEELSSLQSELQTSLVESRGAIHQLLTEQQQVFGDLRFTYQQLSVACHRLQDSTNTTTAMPLLKPGNGGSSSGSDDSGSAGAFEITTEVLSRHCSQLSVWCSNHLTSLLHAVRSGAAVAMTGAAVDVAQKRPSPTSAAAGLAVPQPGQHVLDNVQWRPSNAESVAHNAVLTRLPHYTKRAVSSPIKKHSPSLGLSSTWKSLDYSTYTGCSQCKGQVQIL